MVAERLDPDSVATLPGQPGPEGVGGARPSLAEKARHPGAVSADAAYEFANLLTVVLGSLEQLRRQPLDERGQQQLGRAEWATLQAARLTRQALSQAQGEEDVAKVVDLNAVVDGLATMMDSRVSAGMRVTAELVAGSLPVRLDAGLLTLVLLNLVCNAADAMPDGGEVVMRTRGPRVDGLGDQLTAEVSVLDSGTGMPPDVAQRATEALFSTELRGKGIDLGLWMAHSFASTCDGKVTVETAPGQGTTVRLVFPYADEAAQSFD